MKKYWLFFNILMISFWAAPNLFSQSQISAEQLLGDWKIIKCEGKDTEEGIVGSIFHFKTSGILLVDRTVVKDEEDIQQKTGTWKITNDCIFLFKKDEDPKIDRGTKLTVTRFEENMLIIYEPEEKISIVFERMKN